MSSDLKTAAEEVRKAAAVLRMEQSKASTEVRDELTASAENLERLAREIEHAKMKAEAEFDAVFKRADTVLARQRAGETGTPMTGRAESHMSGAASQGNISKAVSTEPMSSAPAQRTGTAYKSSAKPTPGAAGHSREELVQRINTLQKEIDALQQELNTVRSKETATKL